MDILRQILLFLHILGFASLIGGLLVQVTASERRVNNAMRDGIGLAFLAGLGLVGVLEAGDTDVNHAKVGVKLLIGLIVLVLVMANVRKERISNAMFSGILALSVLNVAVAVFWSSVHVS
ncbi:MAG: hypothetical protein ABIN79_00555 [Marmoricola sp.]